MQYVAHSIQKAASKCLYLSCTKTPALFYRFACCISFFFCITLTRAQQVQQFVFTHLSASDGLSTNDVTSVIQDHRGFIWVGTHNGLQRYDGSNFINFKNIPSNKSSILYNIIMQLCEDGKGNIWMLFGNGKIGIFNTMDFTCTEVETELSEQAQMQMARHFYKDKAGNVHLMVQRYGLYSYDELHNKFSYKKPTFVLPEKWDPLAYCYDAGADCFWAGCDSGLVKYNIATGKLSYRNHNTDNDPVIKHFDGLYCSVSLVDNERKFWIVSWPPTNGIPDVYQFDPKTNTALNFEPGIYQWIKNYHEIIDIFQKKDGTVWIAGAPVFAYKKPADKELTFIPNAEKNEFSLHYDYLYQMIEDSQHNLWLATDRGLFIFNPARQYFKNIRTENKERGLDYPVIALQEVNHEIWASTWGDGIFSFDQQLKPLNENSTHNNQLKTVNLGWSMLRLPSGKVWIGCQAGDLYIYDPQTKQRQKFHPKIFKDRTITSIVQDKHGNLWFCLFNGTVIKWDAVKGAQNLEDGFVFVNDFAGTAHKVICDSRGYIWVTTDGEGLKKFDPKTNELLESYTIKGPEDSHTLTPGAGDLLQYNDSLLLFTEGGIGVLNMFTKKIRHITSEEGLPTNTTKGIIKDKSGILWITSADNLCRFNYEKNIFSVYSIKDGLINNRFQLGVNMLLQDGRIVLGSEHDIVIFNPEEVVKDAKAPNPVITEILVNNEFRHVESTLKAGKLKLDFHDNSLMILFTALRYQQQEKLIYYHQLEGLDKEWIRTDLRNEAVYNYLKPGTYIFKVRCSDENGNISGITSFTVQVVAPFWQTNWFYGLLILIAVAVFYWMDKERLKRIFTLQEVRTQIANNLYNEMSKTLNDINILSEISKLKADKDIERSKEYIDQINAKSRRMIEVMDDMLWSIDPANDSMEKTLSRFEEQTEGLSTAAETPVELIVDNKVKDLSLDMKIRHELLIVYKEALQAILQYPTSVPVIVNIEFKKQMLSVIMHTVIEKHYYEHLSGSADYRAVKERAKQLNAEVDIQTDRNHTAIIIQMPVK